MGQPHAQFETGRGVGTVPVNRDGNETLEAELTVLEHEQSNQTEPPQRNRPARFAKVEPPAFGRKPSRRRQTRGVGSTPINREGDESVASELSALSEQLPELAEQLRKVNDVQATSSQSLRPMP